MTASSDNDDLQRLRDIAHSLNCLTEFDFCLLAKITPATAESWRKRCKGPAYILIGNRYLYPVEKVADHLHRCVRDFKSGPVL